MSRKNEELKMLCVALDNNGRELLRNPRNAKPLRILRDILREKAKSTKDEQLVMVCYFLHSLIDDIWFNLMGDVSPYVAVQTLAELCQAVGKELINISEALTTSDLQRCFSTYPRLTCYYYEALAKIEEKT